MHYLCTEGRREGSCLTSLISHRSPGSKREKRRVSHLLLIAPPWVGLAPQGGVCANVAVGLRMALEAGWAFAAQGDFSTFPALGLLHGAVTEAIPAVAENGCDLHWGSSFSCELSL